MKLTKEQIKAIDRVHERTDHIIEEAEYNAIDSIAQSLSMDPNTLEEWVRGYDR